MFEYIVIATVTVLAVTISKLMSGITDQQVKEGIYSKILQDDDDKSLKQKKDDLLNLTKADEEKKAIDRLDEIEKKLDEVLSKLEKK